MAARGYRNRWQGAGSATGVKILPACSGSSTLPYQAGGHWFVCAVCPWLSGGGGARPGPAPLPDARTHFVVKLHVDDPVLPDTLVPVARAVYFVWLFRRAVGVKVTVLHGELHAVVPFTTPPAVERVSVADASASSHAAVTVVVTGTFVAPAAGKDALWAASSRLRRMSYPLRVGPLTFLQGDPLRRGTGSK
jgi:hypothetical protein